MNTTAVLMAVMMMAAAASAIIAPTTTRYTLLTNNTVDVTQSSVKCKNGTDVYVTTEVTGVLYELSKVRTSFSGDKWQRRMTELDRVSGDEQGHVVASVFGGPVEEWNLVPQYRSVNRRINAENNLINRWDEWEKWAREELAKNNVPIKFEITIHYDPADGCRPIGFDIFAKSSTGIGFSASFANGPNDSFSVSSASRRPKK